MKYIIPWSEIEWSATRSSGAGGQHVNRTNSAVQLRFSISQSLALSDFEKSRLLHKLAHRLIQNDEILIRSEDQRDQLSNKNKAYQLLNELIIESLKVPKKRFATKPKKSSIQKRLTSKKHRGEIKKNRKNFSD